MTAKMKNRASNPLRRRAYAATPTQVRPVKNNANEAIRMTHGIGVYLALILSTLTDSLNVFTFDACWSRISELLNLGPESRTDDEHSDEETKDNRDSHIDRQVR